MPRRKAGFLPDAGNNMPHGNRARYHIDPAGDWRRFAPAVAPGATPLGTIRRETLEGALLKRANGDYVLVAGRASYLLTPRKVEAALASLPHHEPHPEPAAA